MVEEAASAAASMNYEAGKLTQSLDVFKLSGAAVSGTRTNRKPNQLLRIADNS
jgi:hypothetical protein